MKVTPKSNRSDIDVKSNLTRSEIEVTSKGYHSEIEVTNKRHSNQIAMTPMDQHTKSNARPTLNRPRINNELKMKLQRPHKLFKHIRNKKYT